MEQRCVIVASGPSARGFTPPPGMTVIAVNGAIEWLPRADYFFTLDWADINMKRLRERRKGVRYCAAFPLNRWMLDQDIRFFHRISGKYPAEPRPIGSPEWWCWRLEAHPGLCEDKGSIATGNSAYGALGLAYHLGFRDVALIGVDATADMRVEGGHSRNLSHLPLLFQSALAQVRVTSCGRMRGIPQMAFHEWMAQC